MPDYTVAYCAFECCNSLTLSLLYLCFEFGVWNELAYSKFFLHLCIDKWMLLLLMKMMMMLLLLFR